MKIVQLGNPLPTYDSPLQFAEEIAMIDMISEGRLVSGIVRGAGQESICLNANPAYNRERFDEAHNLLVKTMTDDGPFAWEGEHYQFRVVNPWVRVLQQPHPRIWVPGVLSPETLDLGGPAPLPLHLAQHAAASHGQLWDIYDEAARQSVTNPGPRTGATCCGSTCRTPRRRPSRAGMSSCGCRASSPVSATRTG